MDIMAYIKRVGPPGKLMRFTGVHKSMGPVVVSILFKKTRLWQAWIQSVDDPANSITGMIKGPGSRVMKMAFKLVEVDPVAIQLIETLSLEWLKEAIEKDPRSTNQILKDSGIVCKNTYFDHVTGRRSMSVNTLVKILETLGYELRA